MERAVEIGVSRRSTMPDSAAYGFRMTARDSRRRFFTSLTRSSAAAEAVAEQDYWIRVQRLLAEADREMYLRKRSQKPEPPVG